MLQLTDGTQTPLIDASVHIFFRNNRDFRGFLREPYRSRGIPDVEMDWYGAPGGEYAPGTTGPGGQYPGSDPNIVGRHLFDQRGIDIAVLHPMTRGILPDRYLTTAVLSAHNEMMISRWLESGHYAEHYRGTLRVNPDDIAGAVREIKRWQGNTQIVQIGVPLQSRELYGKPQYWPLWEAAQEAGWPVAVHIETGSGIELAPTPSGHTRTYEQYASFMPLNYLYHLLNMIAEGVFERFPNLKFVFADGGGDMLTPFMWRMDTFGRPHLEQTPWAPRIPSAYLPEHVYFIHNHFDGPPTGTPYADEWLEFTGKQDMLLFGSSYPHWHQYEPAALPDTWSPEHTRKVCWDNAAELYSLPTPAPAA